MFRHTAYRGRVLQNLLPSEIEALVALRALMEEGMRRSADASVVGRRVAVVVLDGAVESAIGACLDHLGATMAEGDRLEGGYSRLLDWLRAAGAITATAGLPAWGDVRRLRRIRNEAQHHGIAPDHETLVRSTAAVQAFVEGAVATTFGTDLSLVTLSEALATPSLAAGFREAERLLDEEDAVATIKALTAVFDDARGRFEAEHRDASPRSGPLVLGFGHEQDPATAYVEDLLSVSAFATDLGEYIWWRSVRGAVDDRNGPGEVSIADARRGMAFVFTWVLRWEAFSATYVARQARNRPVVPPASPHADGSPVLLEQPVEVRIAPPGGAPHPERRHTVLVRFACGSETNRWEDWREHVRRGLAGERTGLWSFAYARDDGAIEFHVGADVDGPALMQAVAAAFSGAVASWEHAQVEELGVAWPRGPPPWHAPARDGRGTADCDRSATKRRRPRTGGCSPGVAPSQGVSKEAPRLCRPHERPRATRRRAR